MTAEGTTKAFRVTLSLPDNPSKDDEIDAIVKLVQKFQSAPPGRFYLRSLFTPNFCNWVAQRIRNDFPPDLWGTWEGDKHLMEGQLRVAIKEANDAKAALAVALEAVEATKRLWAEAETLKDRTIATVRNDRDEAIDLYRKYAEQSRSSAALADALTKKVVALKAELYDAAKTIERLTPKE